MATTTTRRPELTDLSSRTYQLMVGGQLQPAASGEVRATSDPSTGAAFADYVWGGAADAERAVAAARAAQRSWADLDVFERGEVLRRAADVLEAHLEELALLDAVDAGNPVTAMRADVRAAIRNLRRTVGVGPALHGRVLQGRNDGHYFTTSRPYGVVVKIVPFNHPALFAIAALAPVLLAGNCLVLKPADQTPLSALRVGELLKDVMPAGVLNVVSGGVEVGDALVRHPHVKRIAFTGSVPVARAIQRAAAESGIKHVSAELGGKNPLIVYPDVDVAAVADGALKGMNLTVCQGQSCGSTSRVYVHRSIHDEFVDALVARHEALVLGRAYDEDTDVGPLVTAQHRERVLGHLATAEADGAQLVHGGHPPEEFEPGSFLVPAVLTGVDSRMAIAQDEVFGPVTSVIPWDDEGQVLAEANGLELALTASVWTDSLETAMRAVESLEAGYVWVNETADHVWGLPFGGLKNSGLGREEDLSELESFLETQAVTIRYSGRR